MIKEIFNPLIATSFGFAINERRMFIRDVLKCSKCFNVRLSMSLLKGMTVAHHRYNWNPEEYLLYHYEKLSAKDRGSFVSEKEHVKMANFFNSKDVQKILADKWVTYTHFKPYFNRQACEVKSSDYLNTSRNFQIFKEMLNQHGKLILKAFDGSFGKGIKIVITEDFKDGNYSSLFKEFPMGFIAEELIVQDPRMAVLHPESVNTLRIHTICYDNKVTVFHPYIRIGRGKSFVDNAGSGGVFTSVDPNTGRVLSVVDEFGHTYDRHPDNDFPIVGFVIPRFEEAFEVAEQLAKHLPDLHYAGWDLALTTNGWVLVEGNPRAQLIFQISEQRGFRDELNCIMKQYNIVYE